MSFLIPTFVPKTVTDLTSQLNEESELSKREAALREQVRWRVGWRGRQRSPCCSAHITISDVAGLTSPSSPPSSPSAILLPSPS